MNTAILVISILITLGLTSLFAQNINNEDPLNGNRIDYYPNGKVSKVYMLEKGQINGIYRIYNQNGFLVIEQEFFHGVTMDIAKHFLKMGGTDMISWGG